jgi:CheY-like chemotaxis protein
MPRDKRVSVPNLISMKILIAEDEPIMLKTMELKLKRDGHTVVAVNNGRDAIQLITENEFNLVITDIMSQKMSSIS